VAVAAVVDNIAILVLASGIVEALSEQVTA